MNMETTKTCSHDEEYRVILSGTKVRQLLSSSVAPPPEFSRPEVVEVLMEYYKKTAMMIIKFRGQTDWHD